MQSKNGFPPLRIRYTVHMTGNPSSFCFQRGPLTGVHKTSIPRPHSNHSYNLITYMTYLLLQFLHVEFNIPLCRAQLWNFENSENINLKAHDNEKMVVKEREPYFNII